MKKWLKVLLTILGTFTIICVVAFRSLTYSASETALESATVAESQEDTLIFYPQNTNGKNIIFYQGGFVESEAYAPLASALANEGFTVYLIDTPLNLAVLATNRGLDIIKENDLTHVIFMGHSLGGVIAARNAATLSEDTEIAGLILLASYPDESINLADAQFPVLSITASNDKVLNWEAFASAKALLPPHTSFVEILGGNHSGFGDYGFQSGDGEATLTNEDQRAQVISAIQSVWPE